jgi:hypothetical protein
MSVPAQFVYPFTLEPHILTLESSRRTTLAAHATRREAYLQAREDERERRKREALRKVAPGFEPQAAPLVPVSLSKPDAPSSSSNNDGASKRPEDVMEDLVNKLAEM